MFKKDWQRRLTETMALISSLNAAKAPAIQAYINGLTMVDRKRLSEALSQGYRYAHNNFGKAKEKNDREWRRALALIIAARANTGVPANDLARGLAGAAANPGAEGQGLVRAELSDLPVSIQQAMTRPVGLNQNWGGWDGTRERPLLAGCAIGQRGTNGPGTLGCFVMRNNQIHILTNMHVLVKAGVSDRAVLQPSHLMGGTYFDDIADMVEVAPELDAAIALVKPGIQCENRTQEGVAIMGSNLSLVAGDPVRKRGVATLARDGICLGDNAAQIVRGDLGPVTVVMTDQVLIEQTDDIEFGFQVPGDSGSAVINAAGEVVALMHGQVATNVAQGQATKIGPILARWGLTIMAQGLHAN